MPATMPSRAVELLALALLSTASAAPLSGDEADGDNDTATAI